VNSLIRAQLKPVDEGAEIKAEAWLLVGEVVPIETTALSVPLVSKVRQESTILWVWTKQSGDCPWFSK